MGYQVLARKWRPKTFDQVIGQENIVRSLRNALTRGQFGHAYLLAGTRGIGKTTVARIMAMTLRCTQLDEKGNPCGICDQCRDACLESSMDVFEIDGASHNGVENIRELIADVHYLPTSGQYKIYIIDEVHMLSISAFNALLKTLESPPGHVIFIFATTHPEKIPETILSRCQRFDFKNASLKDLTAHVKYIAQAEGIHFKSDDLILKICQQGKGSVRSTLSLLDQVLVYAENENITEEDLFLSLGLVKSTVTKKIVSFLLSGNIEGLSSEYRQLLEENIPLENIATSLLDLLFFIIEHSENIQALYQQDVLPQGVLDDIELAELYFIYETFLSDAKRALESLIPEQALEIVLRKITLRRDFFQGVKLSSEKKKEFISPPKPILEVKNEISQVCINKSWEGFLEFVFKESPALASNLEQGNILSPVEFSKEIEIELGFAKSSSVFYDYFQDKDVWSRLISFLERYTGKKQGEFNIRLLKLDERQEKEENFRSRSDLRQEEILKDAKQKEGVVRSDPLLKEFSQLFNASIDKVILEQNE